MDDQTRTNIDLFDELQCGKEQYMPSTATHYRGKRQLLAQTNIKVTD